MRLVSFSLLVGLMSLSAGLAGAAESPLYRVGNRLHGWASSSGTSDAYLDRVQPLLSARCVACHGCYEAPCQLSLESYEALRRGFNPEPIYGSRRTETTKPTRMIDAKSLAEWRAKGFSPVVAHASEAGHEQPGSFDHSLLFRFVDQAARHNAPGFPVMELWPIQQRALDQESHVCVATQDQMRSRFSGEGRNRWGVMSFEDFVAKSRFAGMPFALPRLDDSQETLLKRWMETGAVGPTAEAQALLERPSRPGVVAAWEAFLNGDSHQAQQSARYIYEHVFSAQIHFAEAPGEYYELVRSRTRSGAIDQIVTELPYDAPGVDRVYYRLRKITRALVQKTQIVWEVSDATLARLKSLFLESDWGGEIPAPRYGKPNPFEYFASIPARIRYRFLIENSRLIVAGMTQGSVCVGSRATYAIGDHFWVWFLKPEIDPSVVNPSLDLPSWDIFATAPLPWEPKTAAGRVFLAAIDRLDLGDLNIARRVLRDFRKLAELTPLRVDDRLTAEIEESGAALVVQLRRYGTKTATILGALHHFLRSTADNQEYQEAFERSLRLVLQQKGRGGLSLDDLWTGDGDPVYPRGNNPNAWLNVTRHEKSASVQLGSDGGTPQTIWVLSYSNFERLYYNLVASFKNWGSISHRLATWRHMSYVRLEGEDLALSLLPLAHRAPVRKEFTRGLGGIKNLAFFPLHSAEPMFSREPRLRLPFLRPDLPPRRTEAAGIQGRTPAESLSNLIGAISRRLVHVNWPDGLTRPGAEQLAWERPLHELTGRSERRTGDSFARHFPNVTFVKVTLPSGEAWGYTLQADRSYDGHNLVFAEKLNRDPEGDTLALYHGFVGGYANLFVELRADQLGEFVAAARGVKTAADWAAFRGRYGIARNSARFWPFYDWLHAWKAAPRPGNNPVEQGIVDLSQYEFFEE